MSEQHRFGKHWLRVEEEGLIFLKYSGSLTLPEAERLAELVAELAKDVPDIFMIFDVTDATTIEPAARRFCMKWLSGGSFAGAANFGGGLMVRTMGEMLMSAMRHLRQSALPTTFVKTETEARQWIADQRRLRAARKK